MALLDVLDVLHALINDDSLWTTARARPRRRARGARYRPAPRRVLLAAAALQGLLPLLPHWPAAAPTEASREGGFHLFTSDAWFCWLGSGGPGRARVRARAREGFAVSLISERHVSGTCREQ